MRPRALVVVAVLAGCHRHDAEWPDTGVVRSYTTTVTMGAYDLRMDGGMVMGVTEAFLLDDQFLGPTLVADAGDTIEVTVVNQTDVDVGLHPHGVHYDKENEGVATVAPPGGE